MATVEQYARWLVANQDKRGTEQFATVARAYKAKRAQQGATGQTGAQTAPQGATAAQISPPAAPSGPPQGAELPPAAQTQPGSTLTGLLLPAAAQASTGRSAVPLPLPGTRLMPAPRPTPLDLAPAVASGLTANWADEILSHPMAWMESARTGQPVRKVRPGMLEALRSRATAAETLWPTQTSVAQFGGAMAPVAKGMQALSAGKNLATRLASSMGGGALVGAGYTGLEELGDIESTLDSLTPAEINQVLRAAGTGAAVGLAAGVAAPAISGTAGRVVDWLQRQPQDVAGRYLARIMDRAGLEPADARQRAAQLGPEASFVDATGEVGVGAAQGLRQEAPYVARIFEENFDKNRLAKERITQDLGAVTGKGQNYYRSLDNLETERRLLADRMYGAALDNSTMRATNEMREVYRRDPLVKQAWKDTVKFYRDLGEELPRIFTKKSLAAGDEIPARAMQYFKFQLDEQASNYKGSLSAADKTKYRQLLQSRDTILSDLYQRYPLYRDADRMYAGRMALEDAQAAGLQHGVNKLNIETQLEHIRGLNESEKDAYLQGVVSFIRDRLGRTDAERLGPVSALGSQNAQEVLTELVGARQAERLLGRVRAEGVYRNVEGKVLHGSQTAPRVAAREELREGVMSQVASTGAEVLQTGPFNTAINALRRMDPRMDPAVANELARTLTKPGGAQEAIDRLVATGMQRQRAATVVRNVSTLMRTAATVLNAQRESLNAQTEE